MTQEMPDVLMYVEAMGCPTTCQHCWAVGRPYQAMPLEEISWVLHEVRRFCDAHDLTVDGYPMHEVAAHLQAAHVMRLFHDLWNVVEEPVPTTGVPLATRDDWRELLETLRSWERPRCGLPSTVPARSTTGPCCARARTARACVRSDWLARRG